MIPTPAAFTPPCTAGASGPCASMRALPVPRSLTNATAISSAKARFFACLDFPTQIGLDSDHALAQGEVGKGGVAIDSIEDMEILFDRIPLEKASTSMTINSTAAILLCTFTWPSPKNRAPTLPNFPAPSKTTSLRITSLAEPTSILFELRCASLRRCLFPGVAIIFSSGIPSLFPAITSGSRSTRIREVAFTLG